MSFRCHSFSNNEEELAFESCLRGDRGTGQAFLLSLIGLEKQQQNATWSLTAQRHFHCIQLSNGSRYFGGWVDGAPNEAGVLFDPFKKVETGVFKKGKLHGHGRRISITGELEEGQFHEGLLNGKGVVYDCQAQMWVYAKFEKGEMTKFNQKGGNFPPPFSGSLETREKLDLKEGLLSFSADFSLVSKVLELSEKKREKLKEGFRDFYKFFTIAHNNEMIRHQMALPYPVNYGRVECIDHGAQKTNHHLKTKIKYKESTQSNQTKEDSASIMAKGNQNGPGNGLIRNSEIKKFQSRSNGLLGGYKEFQKTRIVLKEHQRKKKNGMEKETRKQFEEENCKKSFEWGEQNEMDEAHQLKEEKIGKEDCIVGETREKELMEEEKPRGRESTASNADQELSGLGLSSVENLRYEKGSENDLYEVLARNCETKESTKIISLKSCIEVPEEREKSREAIEQPEDSEEKQVSKEGSGKDHGLESDGDLKENEISINSDDITSEQSPNDIQNVILGSKDGQSGLRASQIGQPSELTLNLVNKENGLMSDSNPNEFCSDFIKNERQGSLDQINTKNGLSGHQISLNMDLNDKPKESNPSDRQNESSCSSDKPNPNGLRLSLGSNGQQNEHNGSTSDPNQKQIDFLPGPDDKPNDVSLVPKEHQRGSDPQKNSLNCLPAINSLKIYNLAPKPHNMDSNILQSPKTPLGESSEKYSEYNFRYSSALNPPRNDLSNKDSSSEPGDQRDKPTQFLTSLLSAHQNQNPLGPFGAQSVSKQTEASFFQEPKPNYKSSPQKTPLKTPESKQPITLKEANCLTTLFDPRGSLLNSRPHFFTSNEKDSKNLSKNAFSTLYESPKQSTHQHINALGTHEPFKKIHQKRGSLQLPQSAHFTKNEPTGFLSQISTMRMRNSSIAFETSQPTPRKKEGKELLHSSSLSERISSALENHKKGASIDEKKEKETQNRLFFTQPQTQRAKSSSSSLKHQKEWEQTQKSQNNSLKKVLPSFFEGMKPQKEVQRLQKEKEHSKAIAAGHESQNGVPYWHLRKELIEFGRNSRSKFS